MKKQLLTEHFFKRNPPQEFSAARIQYSFLTNPDLEHALNTMVQDIGMETEAMRVQRSLIDNETDPEALLRWMRREVAGLNKMLLCRKALDMEDILLPEIQRRILTTRLDVFVENAVFFFVRAQTDCTQWIVTHFNQVRDPYAQSMLCLALGFRAGPDIVPWMMSMFESLKAQFPSESFSQGPLLALYELRARFETL